MGITFGGMSSGETVLVSKNAIGSDSEVRSGDRMAPSEINRKNERASQSESLIKSDLANATSITSVSSSIREMCRKVSPLYSDILVEKALAASKNVADPC